MNRTQMAAYLDAWVPEIKADLKLSNWDAVIDQALIAFGVDTADLATYESDDTDDTVIRLLLQWWALERGMNAYSIRVSFSFGNPATSVQANQAVIGVKMRQDAINKRLSEFGYGQEGITAGNVLVNWLTIEPVV
jgi:hypothetical protein